MVASYLTLVSILALVLAFGFSDTSALFPENEYYILETLFNSTDGENWQWVTPYNNITGYPWEFRGVNVSNPCLEIWQGIVCSGDCISIPCTVTAISLPRYYLNNEIPDSLGGLLNLVNLDLSGNVLTGTTNIFFMYLQSL